MFLILRAIDESSSLISPDQVSATSVCNSPSKVGMKETPSDSLSSNTMLTIATHIEAKII
jgi:hypothetical protein